jgi:large subunit ribosomal protein L21
MDHKMFAVIKTGGKQYRVSPDDVIKIERIAGEAGDKVAFEDVLMLDADGNTTVGAPLVAGATVTGELVEQARGEKIIVFKKKRRKNYRRTNGHRQELSVVRITDISGPGAPKAAAKKAAPKKAEAEDTAAEPAADNVVDSATENTADSGES